MIKKILCITLLFTSLVFNALVRAEGPGSTSANFLKAGQGVRAIAMGETYVSLGDDLDTLNWNPAGLVQLDSPTANFSHTFWFENIGSEYIAFGTPLGILGAVAGGLTLFHVGSITETLEDDQGNYAGEGSTVSPMSFALTGGYSQKLSRLIPLDDVFLKQIIVGANLKLVTESLDEVTVFGGAVDIGAIWRETEEISPKNVTLANSPDKQKVSDQKPMVRDNGWRLGLVVQNLGLTSDKALPINLKAGIGYVAQELFSPKGKGTVAVDLTVPNDNDLKVSFGSEYALITPHTMMAARLGYKIGSEINDLDSMAGLTVGFGFSITAQLLKYQLDYAFVPYGELGSTHRLSLSVAFLPSPDVTGSSKSPAIKPVQP